MSLEAVIKNAVTDATARWLSAQPEMNLDWLTEQQACELLAINAQTLRKHFSAAQSRTGTKIIFYSKTVIDQIMRENMTPEVAHQDLSGYFK